MATLHMRYPGGLSKALTFSYDDGVEQDIRLVDIFDKYGLKGTFNINTGSFAPEGKVYPAGQVHRRMTEKQTVALFKNSNHEVAVHTLTHPFLEQLPSHMVVNEVLNDRINIETLLGAVCRGMAYPFGFTFSPDSQETVDVLKSCDIVYSRTTTSSLSLNFPTDWLRLKPTCHHNHEKLDELTDKFLNEKPTRAPYLFYVWGHSYEFEEKNNWDRIETFCERVSGKDDVWYATNIEIFDYALAYRSLRFSVKGDRVFNPTCYEIFFFDSRAGKEYSVKPGETLELQS